VFDAVHKSVHPNGEASVNSMKIAHVALFVKDLEAVKEYYVRYFDAIPNGKYRNEITGLQTYFLKLDGGASVEIMSRPGVPEGNREMEQTGLSHIAFCAGSREAVDSLTERMEADGFRVVSRPRVTGDGYYESVVLDPEGNRIEITE